MGLQAAVSGQARYKRGCEAFTVMAKFYTLPTSGNSRVQGYIVPANSMDGAVRRAKTHIGNQREPDEVNKSMARVSTAEDIMNSDLASDGPAGADFVVLEKDRAAAGYY